MESQYEFHLFPSSLDRIIVVKSFFMVLFIYTVNIDDAIIVMYFDGTVNPKDALI